MKRPLKIQLSILMFLQFFIWSSWYVSGGTYLLETLHFTGTQVGMLYATLAISAMFSPFISGILADRFFSAEKLLAIFHGVGGLLLLWLSIIEDYYWFYGVLLVYTFMYIPTFALSSSLVFHHVVDRARDFTFVRVWGTVGWVTAGFLVGGLVWEATAWPLRLAGGSSLLTAAFCFFLPPTPPLQSREVGLGSLLNSEASALLRNRAFIIFMVGLTLTRIPASFYYSFVNPYLFDAGIPNPTGKMSLGQVVEIFLMLSFPFAFRHLGLKRMFLLGMTAWGARYLLFAYAGGNAAMIYTAILLHGVCYNYTSLVGQIYVDQTVPVHLRSTAQGFITFISMGLGALVGSYLAGFVVESYTGPNLSRDWTSIFLIPGVVGVVTVLWFAVAFRPKGDD